MTILSNEDILKELGENIYIYPFKKSNLKGASYNLTVSKLAWDIRTKKSIYVADPDGDSDKDKIIIPSQTTVLIETLECVWVSSDIAGTYHSKVSLVSKGLSHVGTTLDPEYVGPSLIAIHNHSQSSVELKPEAETFVTLKFHYLETKASIKAGNHPGRPEMLYGYDISSTEDAWLAEPFRNTPDALKVKLAEASDFQELLEKRQRQEEILAKEAEEERKAIEKKVNIQKKKKNFGLIILGSSVFIIFPIILAGFLSLFKEKLGDRSWYDPLVAVSYAISATAFAGSLTFAYWFLQATSSEE